MNADPGGSSAHPGRARRPARLARVAWLLILAVLATACASRRPPAGEGRTTSSQSSAAGTNGGFELQAGIRVVALRLSAHGHLLDLRYTVEDPEKAHVLLGRKAKPMLVDPDTGLKFTVPDMAYVGAMRQTAVAPQEGKTYFILFGNPGRTVQAGKRMDLVLGDLTLPGLTVE